MRAKKPRTTAVTPKNLLIAMILMALHRSNSSYGYKLMEETKAFWREAINRGTVYRMLRQMEKNGIIKSTWDTNANGPARRMYSITDEGEAYLDLWIESLKQYQSNVEAFLKLYNRPPNRDE